ncbi:UNVERIFIED_CONTAM: hypothetical protein B566_EDAN019091 [Ephemera danica]|nr:hypothetical protein B566_EDAN019091 [Ephemera danica]
MDDNVVSSNIKSTRNKRDGYTLFVEHNIWALQSNVQHKFVYFKCVCAPAMKPDAYNILVCLVVDKKKPTILWTSCDCPAGVDGECKHVVATLFKIHSLYLIGAEEIDTESLPACTSRLQMWHVKRSATDEALFFTDLNYTKAYKIQKKKKNNHPGVLGSVVKHHNPLPPNQRGTTEQELKLLVNNLKSHGYTYPILSTITANSFIPVEERKQCRVSEEESLIHELHLNIMETEFQFDVKVSASSEAEDKFLQVLKISREDCIEIERETRLQAQSLRWADERAPRITASMFHTLTHLRTSTDPIHRFSQKRKFFTSRATTHGIKNECNAFALFVNKIEHEAHCSVGLVINPKIPFLGASPDRLIKVNGEVCSVEIKCPFKLFDKKQTIKNAYNNADFYINIDISTNTPFLKKNHEYYSQVQGQLLICNLKTAYFVVFVPPKDIEWLRVHRDEEHISTMLQSLQELYQSHFVSYFTKELQEVEEGMTSSDNNNVLAVSRRRRLLAKRLQASRIV